MKRFVKTLGEAIQQYLQKEGLLSRSGKEDLPEAWRAAAGEEIAGHTQVCAMKRGVLRILVDSAPLLHELESFRKAELLEAMRGRCPKVTIRELRFVVQSR